MIVPIASQSAIVARSCVYITGEVIDGRVVRAGVSVIWNALSWSGGHEFEPRLGRT